MIIYRDVSSLDRRTPPPWCVGAAALCTREDPATGRLWGIGDSYLLGPAPADAWRDLADGWQVRLAGAIEPTPLVRAQRWCDLVPVASLTGDIYLAPVILTQDRSRAFRVAYGTDFLPALTPEQVRLLALAQELRDLMAASAVDGSPASIAAHLGARYAAEGIAATMHLSVEVLGVLRVIDDALILGVTAVMAGVRP